MTSPSEAAVEIRELAADDEIATFCSGNDALDAWFKTHARDNRRRGFGTTYIAVEAGVVLGFVSTTATSIERARVKRGQGPDWWSALLIARMAVSREHQRRGIGKRLIVHAFVVADAQYKLSGCAAVIVDAKPDVAEFYRQFGFKDLLVLERDPTPTETSPIRMFLPIATVREAIAAAAREMPAAQVPTTEPPS
jgi:GNAT superfamily N-acetyltransferase